MPGPRVAVVLPLLFAATAANAEPEVPANGAQLDLGLAVIGLAYERTLTPRLAVQVEAHRFRTWFMDPDLDGYGAQIRPTVFIGAQPPRGLYLALYLRGDQVTTTIDGTDADGRAWSIGQFVGYTFVFAGRTQLRLGGGVQVLRYDLELDAGEESADTRLLPALDAVLGWHF